MSTFNDFQHINLTNDQRKALEQIQEFLEGNINIFILQGYAGSGKTMMIKGLVDYLNAEKKFFEVMAPTGRASKILRDKTGYGQTIHRTIYNFQELKTIENKDNHSFHYVFPIRENDTDGRILIVDEASMVSSKEAKNELFTFGTDILLNDLLTYSRVPNSTNKILFVGDPAQLPPVGDNSSIALEKEYFENKGIATSLFTLKEIVRQKNNTILQNATKLRSLIGADTINELSLIHDQHCFIKTEIEQISRQYAEMFPVPEIGQGVIIAFSNSQCLQYNRAVRKKIFPKSVNVTSGDLLIVNHNNYHTYGVELMNGEMVKVMEVDQNIIQKKNIPVFDTIDGEQIKKHINLNFRKVTIRLEQYSEEINCLIIDSLLNSPNRDLTITEMKALYIDFVMRFQDEQKERREKGLPSFKVGSEDFKMQLKADPFFNALRLKFGYAITCHKSQGGEWHTTFVDYYGRTNLKDDPLRWSYTATTRAVEKCYAANAPYITTFSQFRIGEIQTLANIPTNALALDYVPVSPYHSDYQHRAKSLKYWEVHEKLEQSPFQILDVNSFGDYQERYTISFEDEQNKFDTYHNGAGIFNEFQAIQQNQYTWHQDLLKLLNQPFPITYNIHYSPAVSVLEKLYGIMQSACAENEIIITNIAEKTDNYFVTYFLKTDAKCALIQFFFNGKEQLTRAMPKSTANGEDEKLNLLIKTICNHVV